MVDSQERGTWKKEADTIQTYASVIERCRGIADCRFGGEPIRTNKQPDQFGAVGINQKSTVVAGDHPTLSVPIEKIAAFLIRDAEAKFGKHPAIDSLVAVIREAGVRTKKNRR